MTNNNAYQKYKENSVYTASPEELTLMLYNGIVKFIMQAQMAIDEKNIQKANDRILRAQAIISELTSTVNKSYAIADNFLKMYDYMRRRLVEANMKKDKEILDEVLGFAKDFRDTWAKAMKIAAINDSARRKAAVANE